MNEVNNFDKQGSNLEEVFNDKNGCYLNYFEIDESIGEIVEIAVNKVFDVGTNSEAVENVRNFGLNFNSIVHVKIFEQIVSEKTVMNIRIVIVNIYIVVDVIVLILIKVTN